MRQAHWTAQQHAHARRLAYIRAAERVVLIAGVSAPSPMQQEALQAYEIAVSEYQPVYSLRHPKAPRLGAFKLPGRDYSNAAYYEARVDHMIHLAKSGSDVPDIMRCMGLGQERVQQVLFDAGLFVREDHTLENQYWAARREHAFLLACEGLTYPEIGARMGVTGTRVGNLLETFARTIHKATRNTVWIVT